MAGRAHRAHARQGPSDEFVEVFSEPGPVGLPGAAELGAGWSGAVEPGGVPVARDRRGLGVGQTDALCLVLRENRLEAGSRTATYRRRPPGGATADRDAGFAAPQSAVPPASLVGVAGPSLGADPAGLVRCVSPAPPASRVGLVVTLRPRGSGGASQ